MSPWAEQASAAHVEELMRQSAPQVRSTGRVTAAPGTVVEMVTQKQVECLSGAPTAQDRKLLEKSFAIR